MTDAFGAFHRVDLVIFDALVNCLVGAFRLADIAIDALIGDLQGQRPLPQLFKALAHGLLNFFANEFGDITVEPGNLLYQRR